MYKTHFSVPADKFKEWLLSEGYLHKSFTNGELSALSHNKLTICNKMTISDLITIEYTAENLD